MISFKEKTERAYDIIRLRKNGLTYKAIGERFDISKERARQIFAISTRRLEHGKIPVHPSWSGEVKEAIEEQARIRNDN